MTEQTLAEQQYKELYQQYLYVFGVLAILVEQEGGVVKLDRSLLEQYNLNVPMKMWHDETDDTYVIEVTPND